MNARIFRRPAFVLGLLLGGTTLIALPACRGETSSAGDGASAARMAPLAPSPVAAAAPATPSLPAGISAGMAYADARRALLAAGWLPLRDPECWDNVGGPATVCNLLPETESCSADGYCRMHFGKVPDATLALTVYGDASDWSKPGDSGNFRLKTFDIARVEAPAGTCPSTDFDAFLRGFASDASVRQAFTAPLVRVAEMEDRGDQGYFPRTVLETAKSYREFNLDYADGAFHFVDGEGKRDAEALALKIDSPAKDVRDVSYAYGMSEGNAYRFMFQGRCWVLTEDPQPPSP